MYMYIYFIPNGFQDTATSISMYSSEIFDMKEILRTVSNASIFCSRQKIGTVCLV
jgi:hypothetical protein